MIIGIDLGTTNSEVAVVSDGKVEIIEDNGSQIMPSCVGVSPGGELLVGMEARNQYGLRPDHTVRSIKRLMGTDEKVRLGDTEYSPSELSAMILRKLKLIAENRLGEPVKQAVITVPAYFNDAQRQATREAGALADLEVLRIINEPTAASLAFEAEGVQDSKHVMVYDLGGGTFDVSIVKMSGDVVEVLASHGDSHLGGDDIDELLSAHVFDVYNQQHEHSGELSPVGVNRLRLACEQLKIDLSSNAAATLAETALPLDNGETVDISLQVTRRDIEELCRDILERTMTSVNQVLEQSGLSAKDLHEIILVGGSTRIPAVADILEEELQCRPRHDVRPELAVAYGAGVMAARLAGEKSHRILVDVTPYTFGTSYLGIIDGTYGPHCFAPIIKAGTPLPARRGQVFYTSYDGQERVQIEVFQGEDEHCQKNIFIGEFLVEELDEDAERGSPILLNMNLDLDGLLAVTAIEQHTGLSKSVVIEEALKPMSDAKLEASRKKISALFGPGTEPDLQVIEGGKAQQDEPEVAPAPDELLIRAQRGHDKLDDLDKEDMDNALANLKQAEEDNDEAAAKSARETIEDILFYVEGRQK